MTIRKLLFHLITFFLLALYLAPFIYALSEGIDLKSVLTSLGGIVVLIFAYLKLGDDIMEIQQRYNGVLSDYCGYLLNYFPQPSKKVTKIELIKKSLRAEINAFCTAEIDDGPIAIKEISVPFKFSFRKVEQSIKNNIILNHLAEGHKNGIEKVFIIGEAGAGKSYTLKKYILRLLEDEQGQIPIYLPISSWTDDVTIKNWIINTAAKMFKTGPNAIKTLLSEDQDQLLLIMDGLDELDTVYQYIFLKKIQDEFEDNNVVITCRKGLFESLDISTVIPSYKLYEILPIENNQISTILFENLPEQEVSLYLKDSPLIEILDSPLRISLLIKVFERLEDFERKSLSQSKKEDFTNTLWNKYIEIVYSEKQNVKFHFKEDKIRLFSASLAKLNKNTPFIIGKIQPEIFESDSEKLFYALFSRLTIGIIIGIGFIFLFNSLLNPFNYILAGALGGITGFFLFYFIPKWFPVKQISVKDPSEKGFNLNILFSKLIIYLTYFIAYLLTLSLCFALLGKKEVMKYHLALPDMAIGVLYAVIFTFVGGIHDIKDHLKNDIQLIEKTDFKPEFILKATVFALKISIPLGLILGMIGAFLVKIFPGEVFIKWITDTANLFHFTGSNDLNIIIALFLSITPIIFFVGIFVGLNDPADRMLEEAEIKRERNPGYSISRTFFMSFLFLLVILLIGLIVSVVISIPVKGWDYGNRIINTSIAFGIFIGVWWGWKDLIKWRLVRLVLFFIGKAPLKISKMLKDLEILGILKRQGALFSFAHDTLYTYLYSESDKISSKKNNLKLWCILALTVIVFSLSYKISHRDNYFWVENKGIEMTRKGTGIDSAGSNLFVVKKSGSLKITSSGLIKVGAFLGEVNVLGTRSGLFGIPLRGSFNFHKKDYRHGTLMVRINREKENKPVYKNNMPFLATYRPTMIFIDSIRVEAGDTVSFSINDAEWQNNSGVFKVRLELVAK